MGLVSCKIKSIQQLHKALTLWTFLFIYSFILPRIYRSEGEKGPFFRKQIFFFFFSASEDNDLMFTRRMWMEDGLVLALKHQPISPAAVQGFCLHCHMTITTGAHRDFTATGVTIACVSVLRVNSDLSKWFDPVYWDWFTSPILTPVRSRVPL